MNWLRALRSALTWVFRYPLLPLQVLLFFLIAWGRLGYELGVEDLFWSERVGEQILNGFSCDLLFGEILLVRYLLDPDWSALRSSSTAVGSVGITPTS